MSGSTDKPILVKARGLTKVFNRRTAVDNIDFDIHTGEIVGFLGPNGAGKTTTIRMLINILNPTAGELEIFGLNYEKNRTQILRQMNASSGTLTLPGKLTVVQNLRCFADMYGLRHPKSRIDDLIQKFDLAEFLDRPLYSLSTGQQVRVSLAKAYINSPRLLLLDEPTSSLDPDVADRVRSHLIRAVKEEGTTVFLTSHNMVEVEKVCSRVLFLNEGRIQAEGTPRELARRIKRWRVSLHMKKTVALNPADWKEANIHQDQKDIEAEMDRAEIGAFVTQLVQRGAEIEALTIHEPTLEDFFR